MKNEPYYGGIILLILIIVVGFFLRLPYMVGENNDKSTADTSKPPVKEINKQIE